MKRKNKFEITTDGHNYLHYYDKLLKIYCFAYSNLNYVFQKFNILKT